MNGEILSIDTVIKISNLENNCAKKDSILKKIKKFIEDRMIVEQAFCLDMKQCSEILLMIEEGLNEKK